MGTKELDEFVKRYVKTLPFLAISIAAAVSAQLATILGPTSSSSSGATPLLNFATIGLNLNDPCKKFLEGANSTDVEKLNHHEYRIFENCLYYYLANRAQKTEGGLTFGPGIHPIVTLPPNFGQKEVNVKVNQITIQHFQLNEFVKDLSIIGYMQLQWSDERLSWDTDKYRLKKLRIGSANHIWVPFLTTQGHEASMRNENEAMEIRKVETNSEGNITAVVSFRMASFCDDTDFRHFPDDVYKCCFFLEPLVNQEVIQLVADGQPVFTDPKYFRDSGWFMSGTIPNIVRDLASVSQLSFCLNLQRSSGSMRIELSISTWICAIVFLFSPLFGTIRQQLYIKLFLFMMQILTLQLFSNRIGSHLGTAGSTPILMAVHELGMVLNLVSVVFSLVIWVLFRLPNWSLPPYDLLYRLSQLVNKYLSPLLRGMGPDRVEPMAFSPPDCSALEEAGGELKMNNNSVRFNGKGADFGGNEFGGVQPSTISTIKSPATSPSSSNSASSSSFSKSIGRYRNEWLEVFSAIHAIGAAILSLIFLLGFLAIR